MTTDRNDESRSARGEHDGEVVDCITASEGTTRESVDALGTIAASAPGRVEQVLAEITALVTDPVADRPVDDRFEAVRVLGHFAMEQPDHATRAVSALETALGEPTVETPALRALAAVAAEAPAAVDPALDAVGRRLTGESIPARRSALRVLEARADDDPAAIAGYSERLVDAVCTTSGLEVDDHELPHHRRSRSYENSLDELRFRQRSAAVLDEIASAEPASLDGDLDRLVGVLDSGKGRNRNLDEQVVGIVAAVAEGEPALGIGVVDELVAVVDDGDSPAPLRAEAARTLATLADHSPGVTIPRTSQAVPSLGSLLEHEDPTVRANAVVLLSYVAQHSPDDVASLTDALVDRLADEQVTTRAGAVWTLSYLDTGRSRVALREVADTDPHPEVRALAEERHSS